MFSCDGGLVCVVPQKNLSVHPILVGNPVADEWKALPRLAFADKELIIVQLVVEEVATKYYRMMVVCRGKAGGVPAADCYDSRTCGWSTMNPELVYGVCNILQEDGLDGPFVFDCTTITLVSLLDCNTLEDDSHMVLMWFSILKDRLFLLHEDSVSHEHHLYQVSEYAGQRELSDLRRLHMFDSTLLVDPPRTYYNIHFHTRKGFVRFLCTAVKKKANMFSSRDFSTSLRMKAYFFTDHPRLPRKKLTGY